MRELKIKQSYTAASSDLVFRMYLREISPIHRLTTEEEVELAQRCKQGDKSALDTLVTANLRFVISVAKFYQSYCKGPITFNDLISAGNEGLIKAAQRFDETKGFKFISYAVWRIRQSISAFIANNELIYIPHNIRTALTNVEKKENKLLLEQGICTDRDLKNLGLSDQEIKDYHIISRNYSRLDVSVNDDPDSGTLLDVIPGSTEHDIRNILEKQDMHKMLDTVFSTEPEVKAIIYELFGLDNKRPKTIKELAESYNYSSERIRQLRNYGLKKLHTYLSNEKKDTSTLYSTDTDTPSTISKKSTIQKDLHHAPTTNRNPIPPISSVITPTAKKEDIIQYITQSIRQCYINPDDFSFVYLCSVNRHVPGIQILQALLQQFPIDQDTKIPSDILTKILSCQENTLKQIATYLELEKNTCIDILNTTCHELYHAIKHKVGRPRNYPKKHHIPYTSG